MNSHSLRKITRTHELTRFALRPLTLCLLLQGAFFALPAAAQDPVVQLEPALERAEELLQAGSYLAAIDLFQRVDGFEEEAGLLGLSQALAQTGEYDQAIEVLEDAISDYAASARLSTQLAELKRATGQSAEALEILEAVVTGNTTPPVRALVQYGSLLQYTGRRDEALGPLNAAIGRYDTGAVFEAEEIAMVAVASWLLDRFHDANSLFAEAVRLEPENLEAQVLWGDLFMEKFNVVDAEKSYNAALEINRRYTPALVGQAKISGGERSLAFALEVNPNAVAALETMATLLVMNDRAEEAMEYVDRALEVNSESLKSLSILASQAALHEEYDEYARLEAQVAGFSPGNARFYGDMADAFGNAYRFTEAELLAGPHAAGHQPDPPGSG